MTRSAGQFCIAARSRCDSSTECGIQINSIEECAEATAILGLVQLTRLHSTSVPHGCFTLQNGQVYFNAAGRPSDFAMYARSICLTRNTTAMYTEARRGCMLTTARQHGLPHVACCMLHVACRMLHVACCMLHVACCMSHVACRMSHVACRMSHVAC